jgi:hypothetical protein
MPTYTGIEKIVQELRAEKTNLIAQINKLDGALRELGETSLGSPGSSLSTGNGSRRGSRMSAAARRKISLAQKARWAKVKAGKKG